MSRLVALPIPFTRGATDEVNEKLLPNGVFSEVLNGRLPQAGSLRLRRGWRPVTMRNLADNATLTAIDLYSWQDSLVALCLRSSSQALCLATYAQSNAARPWVLNSDSALSPATQLRNVGNIPELAGSVIRASAALTSDGVYGCVLQQSSTESVFRVFKRDTDETVTYGSLTNGSRVRKVVSMGSTFGLVENTGTLLTLSSLNPSGTAPTWASVGTLVALSPDYFDVAVATDATPGALHVAYVSAADALYAQFTFAGAQTGVTKTVKVSDVEAVTLCSDDATVQYVYQAASTHELSLVSFSATSPFTTSAGPTAVNAGQPIVERLFCVGLSGGSNQTIYVASEHRVGGGGAVDLKEVSVNLISTPATHASNVRTQCLGQQLFGGFLVRNFVAACGQVRRPTGDSVSTPTGGVTMYLDANSAPWFEVDYGIGASIASGFGYLAAAPFWPAQCATGDALVLCPRDSTPNTSVTPKTVSCRALKIRSSERRPAAEVGGALYITGGTLGQWVGGLTENGMLFPTIDLLSPSNGSGTLANGTYHYRAVAVWEDERQRTHRSLVSGPAEQVLSGANDTITATVYAPKTLRRNSNLISNPRIELYRTEAGPGELFYLVNSGAVSTFADTVTIVDTLPDASILDQAQLYTQGEFGATSGVLEMAPGRSSAYVAATKRRLVLGSADTSYQWSQVSFPETPIWFAEPGVSGDAAQAYLDDVEGGRITGVAALDEAVFVGTATRLYVTGGSGPNLAGVGEFSPPTQLPSDVGFYSAASLLEVGAGLWFQGTATEMFLLGRGQPAPTLSRAVQARLASTTIVGCGFDTTDNVGVWGTAAATALVWQADTGQWFSDSLPFTPIAVHGHRGRLYAIASDGVVWAQESSSFGDGTSGATAVALRVATGPIDPLGIAGWGRLAAVEVLGEFQSAAAILAEISYDDGLTWTSLGTHTVTGLSAGQAFQREWFPARQRGGRFRVRFTMTPSSTTGEGCRLAGGTVYYTKRNGPTRLDSAKRR